MCKSIFLLVNNSKNFGDEKCIKIKNKKSFIFSGVFGAGKLKLHHEGSYIF